MPLTGTDIDDLTDAGVQDYLRDLTSMWIATPEDSRSVLGHLVKRFDRASPDWPQRVLGLPPVAV